MRRSISPILLAAVALVPAVGCAGSSSGGARSHGHEAAPFSAPNDFEGGAGSGLWGDGYSGPSSTALGCLPGRHYALAITIRNRSSATVTITAVAGPEPAPGIIRRVAVQVRPAPPDQPGDAVPSPSLHAWSAAALVPLAIPPGKRAVVQSNFLMARCHDLHSHRALTVNRRIVVGYRIGARAGNQAIAAPPSQIILTRGPALQRCAPPRGASRVIAWDLACATAVRAAAGCHRLSHGTFGRCTATSRRWDCTFTSASRTSERCWLASKRQSVSVRWR